MWKKQLEFFGGENQKQLLKSAFISHPDGEEVSTLLSRQNVVINDQTWAIAGQITWFKSCTSFLGLLFQSTTNQVVQSLEDGSLKSNCQAAHDLSGSGGESISSISLALGAVGNPWCSLACKYTFQSCDHRVFSPGVDSLLLSMCQYYTDIFIHAKQCLGEDIQY